MDEIDAFYCYEWKSGRVWLADIDPQVVGHFSIDGNGGDPEVRVTGLMVDGTDILQSHSPSVKILAEEIKDAVQNDVDWIAERARDLGYAFHGLGGTDPSAHWKAA